MKKILLILLTLLTIRTGAQVIGPKIKFSHGDLTIYADADTCSLVTIHKVDSLEILRLDEGRSDKWHKEKLAGPYKKQCYTNSGYDLGHLTPSHITSYNDTLNYHSFSMLNQAPQIAAFNRGKWARLEGIVIDSIIKSGRSATVVTGVVYDNNKKTYLSGCRVKIPLFFFKVLIIGDRTHAWIGSNLNGLVLRTNVVDINTILNQYGNNIAILETD